jgi:Zn-dependent peptidase ImmA (M78 family)
MSIAVNPNILIWARESAGLDLDVAAQKLGLQDSAKTTGEEKLSALERGAKKPTRNQLNNFANVYKRPLLTFYLADVPKTGNRGEDFRQTPETRGQRDNGMLDALLRDVKARQELVREILLDEDDFTPPNFVGSVTRQGGVAAAVTAMSETLKFNNTDLSLRTGDPDALFKKLRAAAEACGVFVLVLGNLGSHHTAIAASVFRGFAIADDIAPFVVINSSDARPARAFTLMHELAHIWLGATGVSGDVSTKAPVSDHAKVERFCNDVAGEFLLPDLHFKQATPSFNASDVNAAEAAIDLIASRWSVSEPMVAYRLHRRNELSAGAYETLRGHYHARWQAKLKRDKEKRAPDATGPSRHVLQQFNLGSALVDIIHRTVRGNQLTHTRAAALLGSKPGAVEPFLRQFEAKRGSFRSSAGGRG